MKTLLGVSALALVCVASFALAAPAFAAAAPSNDIPWGDLVANAGDAAAEPIKITLSGIITLLLVKYAGPFGMFIRANYVSDLVGRAVDFAFAATTGAKRGEVLKIDQMPEFMRNVLLFANGNFPWILRFVIKNVRGLVEMALARIVAEVPAEFRYTQGFAAEVEVAGGGIKKFAPFSAVLARVGLTGA